MNFPLYASLVLVAIGLVMVVAFLAIGMIDRGGPWLDDTDPDWDGDEEP